MTNERMPCYLCRKDVSIVNNPSRAIWINCESCGNYSIDDRAQRFYFNQPDLLNEVDKDKLAAYVKKRFVDQKRVSITSAVINKVTRKVSIKTII